jgi:hypothetical protein
MNNLGTPAQGAKVWTNVLRQLDGNAKLTSIVMKDTDFYNLTKFLRLVNTSNRTATVSINERVIRITLRNVLPASATSATRNVVIKMKPRSL